MFNHFGINVICTRGYSSSITHSCRQSDHTSRSSHQWSQTAHKKVRRLRISRNADSRSAADREPENSVEEEDFEGLLPEEDWTVPGGYNDSLSSNTPLGRAIDSACKELDTLGQMVREMRCFGFWRCFGRSHGA
eukprot:jgi/Botrbrau1/1036/Bobra.0076s0008.2